MNKANIDKYCVFPKIGYNNYYEYVGLKIDEEKKDNSRFKFVFPTNYFPDNYFENKIIRIKDDELKENIKNLIVAIYKSNLSQISNDQNMENNNCPIDSIFWIMRNYIEKGYYIEKEVEYRKENNGKIDWKKTIKDNNFLLDNNYNIIYPKFVTKHIIDNDSNLITQIHKYCVSYTVNLFGFLYNLDLTDIEESNIDEEISNKEFMLEVLKKEYYKTFLDSKKELLLNMIKILEWKIYGKSGVDMFSITEEKFEITFEYLVNKSFGNVEKLEQYYPNGKWNINGKDSDSSYLREDSIYDFSKDNLEEKKIFIIDAKYYKYGYYEKCNSSALPKTSSIAKQIIYGEAVESKKCKKYEVYNVFIIPFCCSDNNKIVYVGYAYGDWRKDNKTYDKIYTFKVDLRTLVNNSFNKQDNIKIIKNCIEKLK